MPIGHFRVHRLVPLFQSQSWCTAFHMKKSFHSHAEKTHFHMKARLCMRSCFQKEAQDNSEMAYWGHLTTTQSYKTILQYNPIIL